MAKKSVQDMVYIEVKEIHSKVDKLLQEKIPELEHRLTKVEVKAGLWGGLTGVIGGVLATIGIGR
jgi:hypothetical protein